MEVEFGMNGLKSLSELVESKNRIQFLLLPDAAKWNSCILVKKNGIIGVINPIYISACQL